MARLQDGRWSSHPMALVRSGCQVLPWDPTPVRLRKNHATAKLWLWFSISLVTFAWLGVPAFAQTDVNDVHVTPREVEKAGAP
jgi:hypothetical protein